MQILGDAQLITVAGGLSWPESPRWHDEALWFSDVHNYRLMRVQPGAAAESVAQVPGRPAGLGFLPDGRLLLATAVEKKLYWVDASGRLTLAADLGAHVRGLLNDMIVDASGRAWVGDTGFDLSQGETPRPGALLTWTAATGVSVAAGDIAFPNGLALSDDGRTLYLAESFGERITAFDVGPEGRLAGRRVHAALAGGPDGLCLDAQGALWIPLPMQHRFERIAADGRTTHRIDIGSQRAISCVLGGSDRQQLFLGCCELDDSNRSAIRREGAIKVLRVQTPGAGWP